MVGLHKQELQGSSDSSQVSLVYCFDSASIRVLCTHIHTRAHIQLSRVFKPTTKADTGFRKLSELFGNHFVGAMEGGEVESLA